MWWTHTGNCKKLPPVLAYAVALLQSLTLLEKLMKTNYAAVLIKPDAIRDALDEAILKDIKNSTSAKTIFRKLWMVSGNTVPLIYPEWITRPEFPSMIFNVTQGHSLFVIIEGSNDIYAELTRTKGKMNKDGLRLKYRTHSIEEWQALGYTEQKLQNKIAENRLHTTDDICETTLLCSLAMNHHEIASLEKKFPILVSKIRRHTAIQIWTE